MVMLDPSGGRADGVIELSNRPHVSLAVVLPRDTMSIPVVRHLCQHALRELGSDGACAEDIGLAVTEACANVVQHAGPGEAYRVEVDIADSACELRVLDQGGRFVAEAAEASVEDRARDPMSETGRGLAIIRALMDDLSFESQPARGTVVRMVKLLEFEPDAPAHTLLPGTRPS